MTNQQITNAYIALSRMGNVQLPIQITYKLFVLRQAFKTQFDFVAEQERIIVNRYNGTQTPTGEFQFADEETAIHVFDEMRELHNMDAVINFEKIEIPIATAAAGNLSMNDIQALDGIVIFK